MANARLKKLLHTELPTFSKTCAYWQCLKVLAIIFVVPELLVLISVPFGSVSWVEFRQISFGFLMIIFVAPLFLRMKAKSLFIFLGVSFVIMLFALLFHTTGESYYSQCVIDSYLKGEDYQSKANSLSFLACTNAVAHTQLVINEIEFLKSLSQYANEYDYSVSNDIDHLSALKSNIADHLTGFDERFLATGYRNKSAQSIEETIKGKYAQLEAFVDERIRDVKSKRPEEQ